jgi:2-oxoglutarate dehydrogenase E2 component (dihydrolipoamide succinyltransferase)
MAIEITVPTLGESVADATVARWIKKTGDAVAADEPVVELETDKVTLEVPSPAAGTLGEIIAAEGANVEVGASLAILNEGAATAAAPAAPQVTEAATPAPAPTAPVPTAPASDLPLSPAVRRLVEENNLNPAAITGTGVDGRLTKADVLAHIKGAPAAPVAGAAPAAPAGPRQTPRPEDAAREERVPMSKLRQVIATRLKTAQNNAAMLTTFNEIDMSALMTMRADYRQEFEAAYGTRLGFMGMFVLASIQALQDFPAVNAEIDGTDIVYKNFVHMGIAAGTPQGLVVPVIRNADQMSFAEIEKAIAEKGKRARDGKLSMAEMQGGTFTISNGGVYGSLMSSPILNPPQSGILGMHKIQDRPMVINGEIKIRPMMYLALSYDHRIVDGKGAVTFLVRVKDACRGSAPPRSRGLTHRRHTAVIVGA